MFILKLTANFFSEKITSNRHNPRVFFKTTDCVLNASAVPLIEASVDLCEKFFHFFIDKVENTRALITPPISDLSIPPSCNAVFNDFEPVTLSHFSELIGQIKL